MRRDKRKLRLRSLLRRYLTEAQGNRCAYCHGLMGPPRGARQQPDTATLEHVFPHPHGGTDATCVAVHCACNQAKGSRRPTGCELLSLMVVRAKVMASPRLSLLIGQVLRELGAGPVWEPQRVQVCDCPECKALDARFPDEGRQLLLPML